MRTAAVVAGWKTVFFTDWHKLPDDLRFKPTEKSTMKILVFRSPKTKQWYFHVVARNGRLIAQSEGYKGRLNCLKTVAILKSPKMAYCPVIVRRDIPAA